MYDYLLLLLLGITWTFISVILISARRTGISSPMFYFIGNAVSALCCLACFLVPGMDMDDFTAPGKRMFLLCYLASSLLNGMGQAVTMYNLKSGGRVLAISIPQMSFLMPFLWGIILYKEPAGWSRITGVLIIAAAVFVCAVSKGEPEEKGSWNIKRFYLALLSALLLGSSQISVVAAGYRYAGMELSHMTRTFFYMLAALVFFGAISSFEIKKNGLPQLKSIKWGIIWGVVATFSNLLLFYCLDVFTQKNQSGIVYAVGATLLLIGSSIYTRVFLKEKMAPVQYAGVAGMIIGLLLVRLGG